MSIVYYFPHLHKLSLQLEAMKNCAIQYYVKKKNLIQCGWFEINYLEMIKKFYSENTLLTKARLLKWKGKICAKNTCLVNQTISILLVLLNLCFFDQILEDILGNHWWFNKSQNFVQI